MTVGFTRGELRARPWRQRTGQRQPRARINWARARRVAALRWYRTRWATKRLAGWIGPLLLDAAGLACLAVAGFTVALWLGLVVGGLACWALNLRIDRRVREVKRR